MAEALGLLPNVGYVRVLKHGDGNNLTYTASVNPTINNVSAMTEIVSTFSVWEWEVTFVTDGGDLPLMAAVWADGRTASGVSDGFEATGRATRRTCRMCEAFANASWSSTAEASVGLRMEVNKIPPILFTCLLRQTSKILSLK